MFSELPAALALIGIVILVTALLSGAIDRSGLPQAAIFLLLGAVLGPAGLGLINLTLQSPTLQAIATVGLVLVLFSDAIVVDTKEVRRERRLALVVLGPGGLIPALIIAVAGWLLLDLSAAEAAILGAALGSIDPVLLRSLLRHPGLPSRARVALRLESGMDDAVLLPIVVLGILTITAGGVIEPVELGGHAVGLFILGPGLGALIGYTTIKLLEQVRSRAGVRRDYESLYALGVAFTAFAGAEAVGGSGFLAAFAAGLVVASLDVELCDCFLDYGQASAEVFLLFTFVAFGAGLIWSGLTVADLPTLGFASVALLARTLVLLPVLKWLGVDDRSRRLIAWFGPRGLSSLLLILLPVFAGVPGSERLFAITSLVVLLSVVLHGAAIALFLRNDGTVRRDGAAALPAARSVTTEAGAKIPERITLDEVRQVQEAGKPVVIADVRSDSTYEMDDLKAKGAIRLPPDDAVRRARELGLDHHGTVVLYCA